MVTRVPVGVAEVGEDQSAVPVLARAELNANAEGLLKAACCFVKVTTPTVRQAEDVPRVHLAHRVAGRHLEVNRCHAGLSRVVMPANSCVVIGKRGQGQSLAVLVANATEQICCSLCVVEGFFADMI